MSLARLILPLFIIIPIIEISLFVIAGDVFGAGPTLLMIVITAFVGVHFLKQQGSKTFLRFQDKMAKQALPAQELIEGMILLISGVLLVTPGFFTDIIGFIGLIPAVRQGAIRHLSKRWQVKFHHTSFQENLYRAQQQQNEQDQPFGQGRTVDGEYEEAENDQNKKIH